MKSKKSGISGQSSIAASRPGTSVTMKRSSSNLGGGFETRKPMICAIVEDQLPIPIDDDYYLVKQVFQYERPRGYHIEFAKPAIYSTGCLTCGSENAIVEFYGERYCCATCQKSLQTTTGESVILKPSQDGNFIVAQAWRYSKLVKGLRVDIDDLRIRGGHKCHATFAGEKGEIIVLLDEVIEKYIYR